MYGASTRYVGLLSVTTSLFIVLFHPQQISVTRWLVRPHFTTSSLFVGIQRFMHINGILPMVGEVIQYVTFMEVPPSHTCGVDAHVTTSGVHMLLY